MSSAINSSRACVCVMAMLAAGCAVGPDYHSPKPVLPTTWAGPPAEARQPAVTSQSADLARWWEQMRDPTLTSLVEEALKANLSVASAEASLRQARALRGVAVAPLFPSVTGTGSYQRQSGPLYVERGGSQNLFQAGLDAVWEMDIFGGVRRNVESATANVQAAIQNISNVHVSVAAEVALDYIQLRGYQQEAAIARDNLQVQRQALEVTRKLYQAGFDSGLDMAGAETAVAAAEAQVPAYETGARQSIYALSVLLARNPGELVERLTPIGGLPSIPEQIPAGLPSDLLRRRPDIRQAEAQLHSATAQIGVAVAQLFPQFSLTGGVNWASTLGHALFVGPVASWPVFQGGAIVSNIHAQEAFRDAAFMAYRQTVLTALQDVENALVAFAEEQKHQKSLSDAVAADRKNVALSERLYEEGQNNLLTVLIARNALNSDRMALTQSAENLSADLTALYKALGGGWAPAAK